MRFAAVFVAGLFAVVVSACKDSPPPDPVRTEATASSSAKATASGTSPGASASATPNLDAGALAGAWEGSYEAKKGAVVLPKDVKNTSQTNDDGKKAVGAGKLTLVIAPNGDVSGTSTGALGPGKLIGKVDGAVVRASLFPEDPTAPSAMTGVVIAMLKDGALRGQLRVAGPDATVVRESAIELKKK